MASSVAHCIRSLLERRFEISAQRQAGAARHNRVVLAGPPANILGSLYSLLTEDGRSAWRPTEGLAVPVFLIRRRPTAGVPGESCECNWDYALAVRNTVPEFVLLVDPEAWDERTYSIVNATDTVGTPLPPIRRNAPSLRNWSPIYAEVVELAADQMRCSPVTLETAIRESLKDLPGLPPPDQEALPWEIVERLFHAEGSGVVVDGYEISAECGLPSPGSSVPTPPMVRKSRRMLEKLSDFLEDDGLVLGFEKLKATTHGSDVREHLDALLKHLQQRAGSATAFRRARSFFFRPPRPRPAWWNELSTGLLEILLAEAGAAAPETLRLECINPIHSPEVPGEPWIVLGSPRIRASHPKGAFESPVIRRQIRRHAETLPSQGVTESPWEFDDGQVPAHHARLTYTLEDSSAMPASLSLICLDRFTPLVFVTCSGHGTKKVKGPSRSSQKGRWVQEVILTNGGKKAFRAFCAPSVSMLRVKSLELEIPADRGVADFQLELDEDLQVELEVLDQDGNSAAWIQLEIAVTHDDVETAPSVFDALVIAHQTMSQPREAHALDSWLRRLEGRLISDPGSWQPILGCPGWSRSDPRLSILDGRTLGQATPQVDPRPRSGQISPPSDFLAARSRVTEWLGSHGLQMPEIKLTSDEIRERVFEYLRAYTLWLDQSPEQASWIDSLVVLEQEPTTYGSRVFAAHEPIAVLLTPLHPLRLAWQTGAQRTLASAIASKCPLAGLVDPHRCPDILALPLVRGGGSPMWKAYFSVASQDSLWALFWNAARVQDLQGHAAIPELAQAGLVLRGIHTGFTASQARRTLDEVVEILPTRAVMRVGIVGSGRGTTSCSEGVIGWCRDRFQADEISLDGPRTVEILDDRHLEVRPTREEISSLADDSGHAVRWYGNGPLVAKDLTIIDHLGIASPSSEIQPWKSAASPGSLVRNRIRIDRDDAQWVIESRASAGSRSEDSLLDAIGSSAATFEDLAVKYARSSHLAYSPNREVIASELRSARFLGISSAEIDPACFARGVKGAGGFLWDYELPLGRGPAEQRSGFYLLARPSPSIRAAVAMALEQVSPAEVPIDQLLQETSQRGIPILKKLAAGGSLARGEIGMLLAVRLLQDVFRPSASDISLPVVKGEEIHLVLPVDPWSAPLERVRAALLPNTAAARPDLILVCVQQADQNLAVRLVPIEVKFRAGTMSTQEKNESIQQAGNLGSLLYTMLQATPPNDAWRICGRGLLAEMLDYGFRVNGDPSLTQMTAEQWAASHERCLSQVLGGAAPITVAVEGRLIVFDESASTATEDIDGDGFAETILVDRSDARSLLEDRSGLSALARTVGTALEICELRSASSPFESQGPIVDTQVQVALPPPGPGVPDIDHVGISPACEPVPADAPQVPVVPAEARRRVAQAFQGFIGNGAAVETLQRALLRATIAQPPGLSASYLLTGNPSTGKTELARRVARCLGLPFVSLDGRGLVNRDRLFELIDAALRDVRQAPTKVGIRYQRPLLRYPPFVVFIDEIHLVPRAIQESLLTALEPNDRSVLLGNRVALLPDATFLFATTRPSDVDAAFRTRCMEVALQDYTEAEVATIVSLAHPTLSRSVTERIARIGRLVPRVALEVARELKNEMLVSEKQDRSVEDHLEQVRRTRLSDPNGLGPADIQYLELLEQAARPLGEKSILSMLTNIDKVRILEEVEPLLVARLGLVRRTDRGRQITPEGQRFLQEWRRSGSP